ncbi:hypothetical protein I8748_04300 [Nostoc sp. CENA67]|uniref:Transmembrane protein n=1 Tax=Amazonocrinis nigriterrae CENA67 TaxID=2794033 RepID=A0A8J7L7V7_9NOST|nr:hypothetical protein [Amazonocrinis nigriterrae]MBH8561406.1 hypothetical protein [Amazonocrinis nigriterrae CENA67]
MENSQSVQRESTQVTKLKPELPNSKSGLVGGSNIFIYLLTQHPLLLLTGLLTMFLGTAALALYSLGYAGGSGEQAQPEEIPAVVEKPIKTPSETSNPTPLWMVAAIALSCASGCFIILRLLNRPLPTQKVRKHINHHPASVTPSRHQRLEPQTPKNPPVFVPLQPIKPMVSMQAKTKPLVTVLPPEHTHPLDKNQESLADLMDIRKQKSLSSILRSS